MVAPAQPLPTRAAHGNPWPGRYIGTSGVPACMVHCPQRLAAGVWMQAQQAVPVEVEGVPLGAAKVGLRPTCVQEVTRTCCSWWCWHLLCCMQQPLVDGTCLLALLPAPDCVWQQTCPYQPPAAPSRTPHAAYESTKLCWLGQLASLLPSMRAQPYLEPASNTTATGSLPKCAGAQQVRLLLLLLRPTRIRWHPLRPNHKTTPAAWHTRRLATNHTSGRELACCCSASKFGKQTSCPPFTPWGVCLVAPDVTLPAPPLPAAGPRFLGLCTNKHHPPALAMSAATPAL
jgi:hypothetical protein